MNELPELEHRMDDHLDYLKKKYQYRFDYHKTRNWKRVEELKVAGRRPEAYATFRGFNRLLFHIKVTMFGGTVLVALIVIELWG
jgi:hypothetical protein